MDVANLLDSLVLLDALTDLNDVRVESPVIRVGLDVVDVRPESLMIGESDTLEATDSGATHLVEDLPDQVDGREHFLHCYGLRGGTGVDDSFDLPAGPVDD